jgi:hypothetical protein
MCGKPGPNIGQKELGESQWEQTHCLHVVCSAYHLLLAGYLFGLLFNPVHATETMVNFYQTT